MKNKTVNPPLYAIFPGNTSAEDAAKESLKINGLIEKRYFYDVDKNDEKGMVEIFLSRSKRGEQPILPGFHFQERHRPERYEFRNRPESSKESMSSNQGR